MVGAALTIALGVNLLTCVRWLLQPDDGFVQLIGYVTAHVPAGTVIGATDGDIETPYALAGSYQVGYWETPAGLSQGHVRYVVVEWGTIDEGYSDQTPVSGPEPRQPCSAGVLVHGTYLWRARAVPAPGLRRTVPMRFRRSTIVPAILVVTLAVGATACAGAGKSPQAPRAEPKSTSPTARVPPASPTAEATSARPAAKVTSASPTAEATSAGGFQCSAKGSSATTLVPVVGAIANGTTDDSDAIQNAIDLAGKRGGGVVALPWHVHGQQSPRPHGQRGAYGRWPGDGNQGRTQTSWLPRAPEGVSANIHGRCLQYDYCQPHCRPVAATRSTGMFPRG